MITELTCLDGLLHFVRVLGQVQVGHVGLQVTDWAFSPRHTEALYQQICYTQKTETQIYTECSYKDVMSSFLYSIFNIVY